MKVQLASTLEKSRMIKDPLYLMYSLPLFTECCGVPRLPPQAPIYNGKFHVASKSLATFSHFSASLVLIRVLCRSNYNVIGDNLRLTM